MKHSRGKQQGKGRQPKNRRHALPKEVSEVEVFVDHSIGELLRCQGETGVELVQVKRRWRDPETGMMMGEYRLPLLLYIKEIQQRFKWKLLSCFSVDEAVQKATEEVMDEVKRGQLRAVEDSKGELILRRFPVAAATK